MDERGVLRELNPAAERIFGHRREEAIGRSLGEAVVPPHRRAAHTAGLARLLATGQSRMLGRRIETEGMRADGSLFPLELAIVEAAAGGERLFVAHVRDIAAREEAGRALRESEARCRAIAEGVPVPVLISDPDSAEVLFANGRAEEVFGLRAGDPVTTIWADPAARQRYLARVAAEGLVRDVEAVLIRADGGRMDALVSARAVEHGGRAAVLAAVVDVTEQRRAEAELRLREQRFRAIVEDQTEFISRFTPDFTITYVNQAYAAQLGRRPAEIVGTSLLALMTPEQRDRFTAQLAALTPEAPTVSYEMDAVRLDGSPGWEHWTDRALFDAEGRVVEYQSVGRDVTGRRRAEEARRRSEQLFRAIVEDQTEFIIRFGPELRVTTANRAFAEQVGRPREELVGASVLELVEGRRRDRFQAQLASLTPEAPIVSYETASVLPDGSLAWEQWSDRALFDKEGRLTGYQSVGRDVTAAKRAEEELRASEQRLRAIVEGHPVPMTITRLSDHNLLFANRAFLAAFRFGPGELEGFDRSRLFAAGPEERDTLFGKLGARGVIEGCKVEMRRADGSPFPAFATARVVDYEGSPCSVASFLDLSALKAAEAEIARQREALHQSEKMTALGSLLAGVAHELNNPLAVVVGRAIMLEEQVRDPAVADSLRRLREAAERCAKIVKTFLATARQKPRQRHPVDLGRVLDAALDMLAYGLKSAGVEVARELEPDLPPVLGDEDLLHQVLLNLLVNAQQALRDAPPPRRVLVRACREGDRVRVEVADNGPGIPAAIRGRIFEPFFTTKPEGAGTGIGLSVCHAVVAAHDGMIEVDDAPGGGARFTLRLPVAPTAAPAASVAVGTDADGPAPTGRVLVVDDEPEILALLDEVLRREGYAVEVAASGREALAWIDGRAFDLIISD